MLHIFHTLELCHMTVCGQTFANGKQLRKMPVAIGWTRLYFNMALFQGNIEII